MGLEDRHETRSRMSQGYADLLSTYQGEQNALRNDAVSPEAFAELRERQTRRLHELKELKVELTRRRGDMEAPEEHRASR